MKRNLSRNMVLGAAVAVALGVSLSATAATDNLSVTATVINECEIATTAVAFGDYGPVTQNASADIDVEGEVEVTCTDDAAVTITLGGGLNESGGPSATAPVRRMRQGATAFYLSYQLYSDSGRTTVWATDAANDVTDTADGLAQQHVVYGRLTAGQNVPAGAYTDTVVAEVTF